jgi:hypothetical protein
MPDLTPVRKRQLLKPPQTRPKARVTLGLWARATTSGGARRAPKWAPRQTKDRSSGAPSFAWPGRPPSCRVLAGPLACHLAGRSFSPCRRRLAVMSEPEHLRTRLAVLPATLVFLPLACLPAACACRPACHPTKGPSRVHACMLVRLPACLPSGVRACLLAHLLASLPAHERACLHALPTKSIFMLVRGLRETHPKSS